MAKQPVWNHLSREKRDLYLELLWGDGCTELAIANFLQTTKDTIVGRRARLHLGNTPERRQHLKRSVNPDRFRDLLELHRFAEREARGKVLVFDGE